jgi:Holliday junction resolvase RusA-like endonuclease
MNTVHRYDITPVAKPRMTQSDKWKKRPATAKYWAFKDEVRAAGMTLWNGCTVVFHIPMPASWSVKKKHAMRGEYHTQKPDCDNLLKAALDAIYDDDAHLAHITIIKRWADTGAIVVF